MINCWNFATLFSRSLCKYRIGLVSMSTPSNTFYEVESYFTLCGSMHVHELFHEVPLLVHDTSLVARLVTKILTFRIRICSSFSAFLCELIPGVTPPSDISLSCA